MKVSALLESLPGVGKVRAKQIMERLDIAESRRIRGLGRQPACRAGKRIRRPVVQGSYGAPTVRAATVWTGSSLHGGDEPVPVELV